MPSYNYLLSTPSALIPSAVPSRLKKNQYPVAWHIVLDTSFLYQVDLALLAHVVRAKHGRYLLTIPIATLEEIERHQHGHLVKKAKSAASVCGDLVREGLLGLQSAECYPLDLHSPRQADIRIMQCARDLIRLFPNKVACATNDNCMAAELQSRVPVLSSSMFEDYKGDVDLAVVYDGPSAPRWC